MAMHARTFILCMIAEPASNAGRGLVNVDFRQRCMAFDGDELGSMLGIDLFESFASWRRDFGPSRPALQERLRQAFSPLLAPFQPRSFPAQLQAMLPDPRLGTRAAIEAAGAHLFEGAMIIDSVPASPLGRDLDAALARRTAAATALLESASGAELFGAAPTARLGMRAILDSCGPQLQALAEARALARATAPSLLEAPTRARQLRV